MTVIPCMNAVKQQDFSKLCLLMIGFQLLQTTHTTDSNNYRAKSNQETFYLLTLDIVNFQLICAKSIEIEDYYLNQSFLILREVET